MKQNEKYDFEGLKKLHSGMKNGYILEFQSLARDLSLSWHQIYYSEYIVEKSGKGDQLLLCWLISHILYQSGSGHLRTDFNRLSEDLDLWMMVDSELFPGTDREFEELMEKIKDLKGNIVGTWREIIGLNPAIFGSPESTTPFIFLPERDIVYNRKFYKMEKNLLKWLEELAGSNDVLDEIPESSETAEILKSMLENSRLVILSGGPGTGKTTAISSLIKSLDKSERFLLAAPTGRAANRMIESLRSTLEEKEIPRKAWTLHKLLGINPVKRTVLYNRERPLPAELIILDEASMIDVRMMSLLFDALSPTATLLLVGDKDQLPSVDAGAVFADFVASAESENHKLHNNTLFLSHSWRSSSGILEAAKAVIEGETGHLFSLLQSGKEDLIYNEIPAIEDLIQKIIDLYKIPEIRKMRNPEEMLSAYERFTCLIPTRRGLMGVENLNRLIKNRVSRKEQVFYHGQPIMILSNDYNLSLFNGDRGVIMKKNSEYLAVFRDGVNELRFIPAGKLESYETSYCQTVHKSQGSEFQKVLLVIPEGSERMLTREIVYTGITRAREQLILFSSDELIDQSLSRVVVRHSGIREFLGGSHE